MYDFTTVLNRHHSNSIKWSGADTELPMWIADMDFQTTPEIVAAMQAKVATGIFGYEAPPAAYFQAIIDWYARVHHAPLQREWLLFATGVIAGLAATIRRVTNAGDNIVVQAPVYNMFFNAIENAGRRVLSADLTYDPTAHTYAIDFADLEAKLADPLTTAMILCNPHNPIGRIWTRAELMQIADLCQRHGVVLLADEIHGDLTLTEHDYTSTITLPPALQKNLVTFISPGKTFNLASLHAATVIVSSPALRANVARGLSVYQANEPNLLAIPTTIAAYTQGAAWLQALRRQLQENYRAVLAADLPGVAVVPAEATYLLWLDISSFTHDAAAFCQFLLAETGLRLNAGDAYRGNGHDFVRVNVACPPALLQDGLQRLQTGIRLFKARQV